MSPAGLIDIILPFLHLAVKFTALVGYTWNQAHIRYDVFKKLNEELPREDQIPSVEEKVESLHLDDKISHHIELLSDLKIKLRITQNRLDQLNQQENISHTDGMQRTNIQSYDKEETLSTEEQVSKQGLMDTFHELAGISYEEFKQLDLDKQQQLMENLKQDQTLESVSMLMEDSTATEKPKQIVKQLT